MNGQAAADLMNVPQQVRVGEYIRGRLAIQENPILGDSATVDTIFRLE